jgi:tetratricopeptide (TPR) repeat protein
MLLYFHATALFRPLLVIVLKIGTKSNIVIPEKNTIFCVFSDINLLLSFASNIDLFNWGIANFKAESYVQADTVFGLYTQKYPDQAFGYYWRARTNSLRDSAMEKGLAVPHYNQLIEILEKDTTDNKTNKKWLIESYGYLAAYETNEVKDYKTAIENLKKILGIGPENKDAQQYISTLEKKISSDKDTGSNRYLQHAGDR